MARLQHAVWMTVIATLAVAVAAVSAAQTPASGKTASQFYLDYRAAFDKATKIDDLFPYMSAASRKQVESTPAAQRPQMFGMMKMMGTLTAVKVLKEEKAGTGATLTVEGVDSDKQKMKGTISIVQEGGAWKLGAENWSN